MLFVFCSTRSSGTCCCTAGVTTGVPHCYALHGASRATPRGRTGERHATPRRPAHVLRHVGVSSPSSSQERYGLPPSDGIPITYQRPSDLQLGMIKWGVTLGLIGASVYSQITRVRTLACMHAHCDARRTRDVVIVPSAVGGTSRDA